VVDAREPEAESVSLLEGLRVSRRGFLRLSIVCLPLFLASGCGGGQDGGGDGNGNEKKDKKDDGGGGGGAY
jgi:hypothetical protein